MSFAFLTEYFLNKEPKNPKLNQYYHRRGEYLGDGVYLRGRMADQFTYDDNGRIMLFAGEAFPGPIWRGRQIWSEYFRCWGDPRCGEPITEDEKRRILEKLRTSRLGPFVDQSTLDE